MKVCPICDHHAEDMSACLNCKFPWTAELSDEETPPSKDAIIAKLGEIIVELNKIIDVYDIRCTMARNALTRADVPELTMDSKRVLALNERIEILAQAVREVIKDWHDNEYGYLEQKDTEITSSMRSYITQAMQRLMGV